MDVCGGRRVEGCTCLMAVVAAVSVKARPAVIAANMAWSHGRHVLIRLRGSS